MFLSVSVSVCLCFCLNTLYHLSGLPTLRSGLRLHDPGQRLSDASARHQDQDRKPQPDSEGQGCGTEHLDLQYHHAR